MTRSVLFVCTANICRSPTAEGVMRKLLAEAGQGDVEIASAGTHDYQAGMPPSPDAVEAARKRGYQVAGASRRVRPEDFDRFDMILAMDRMNLAQLLTIAPTHCKQKVELLLEYGDRHYGKEVLDPYGGKPEDYARALDLIEDGCRGLLALLARG